MRRRNSASCSSGNSTWKGRMSMAVSTVVLMRTSVVDAGRVCDDLHLPCGHLTECTPPAARDQHEFRPESKVHTSPPCSIEPSRFDPAALLGSSLLGRRAVCGSQVMIEIPRRRSPTAATLATPGSPLRRPIGRAVGPKLTRSAVERADEHERLGRLASTARTVELCSRPDRAVAARMGMDAPRSRSARTTRAASRVALTSTNQFGTNQLGPRASTRC